MARNYPRFLFDESPNAKTPGPYIVHLLSPRFVIRLIDIKKEDPHFISDRIDGYGFSAEIVLDLAQDIETHLLHKTVMEALKWAKYRKV